MGSALRTSLVLSAMLLRCVVDVLKLLVLALRLVAFWLARIVVEFWRARQANLKMPLPVV